MENAKNTGKKSEFRKIKRSHPLSSSASKKPRDTDKGPNIQPELRGVKLRLVLTAATPGQRAPRWGGRSGEGSGGATHLAAARWPPEDEGGDFVGLQEGPQQGLRAQHPLLPHVIPQRVRPQPLGQGLPLELLRQGRPRQRHPAARGSGTSVLRLHGGLLPPRPAPPAGGSRALPAAAALVEEGEHGEGSGRAGLLRLSLRLAPRRGGGEARPLTRGRRARLHLALPGLQAPVQVRVYVRARQL